MKTGEILDYSLFLDKDCERSRERSRERSLGVRCKLRHIGCASANCSRLRVSGLGGDSVPAIEEDEGDGVGRVMTEKAAFTLGMTSRLK